MNTQQYFNKNVVVFLEKQRTTDLSFQVLSCNFTALTVFISSEFYVSFLSTFIMGGLSSKELSASGNRGGGISPNNLPPLLFNNVHGENVTISHNGAVAKRTNSFCRGIVFSDRAVKISEKVCIKFVEISKSWSGVLRFGFTSHDPSTLRNALPRYACPDLTSKPGFWAKAFSDMYVKKDAILYFYVNAAGDVYFGINGEEKGLFFSGVDTRGPLWVLIDIYGNTTGLEFVDPRAQLNNSRSNVSEVQVAHSPSTSIQSEPLPLSSPPPQNDPYKLTGSAVVKVMAKFPNLVLNVDHFNPITKGKHAIVLGSVGRRREGEYSNAYLFPNQPLRPGETIVVCVHEVDYAYASSMAFGLTSCNPKEISHVGFPNDAYRLLDRPEYWVVEKDVANSPPEGAVIGFTLTPDGEVIMKKNDEAPKLLMHVDNSVPLYPFFDLYGTTTQIQLAGIVPASYYRPRLPVENARCRVELPRSSSMQASASPYTSLIRNVPHSVSAVNCSPAKVGASSSSSAASLAAMSANEKNMATYATLNKKVSGPSISPAPSRDAPNWSVECVACCERPVDSVFYSCGHMCMCYQCAVEYWKTKEKGCCPICRATISDVIRTYKS
ncbi:unnamed protein product [Orchesella dallaii]|uniref:Protein neuralized n=2 Tax=Orchesella dallaii TaxID=48710 RepID=A0ABP1PUT7_9HEXA